jgi:DNA topoisomerase II
LRWQQTKAQAKKTTTKAKPASKAATKAKAAPKKKPLADVDENADDNIMDVDHSDNEPGPSVQQEAPIANKKKKTASETYTKVGRVYINIDAY